VGDAESLAEDLLELVLRHLAELELAEVLQRLRVGLEQLPHRVGVQPLASAERGEAVPDRRGEDPAEVEEHRRECHARPSEGETEEEPSYAGTMAEEANEAAATADAPDGIDRAGVEAWFEANVPGVKPPLSFDRISGGRSNLTFGVHDTAGGSWAL